MVQNLVFGSKLDIDSYNLSDITHSDFIQWFLNYYWCYLRLTPKNGGILGVKNLFKNLVFSLYLDIFSFFYFSYLSFPCYSLKSVGPIQISLVLFKFSRSTVNILDKTYRVTCLGNTEVRWGRRELREGERMRKREKKEEEGRGRKEEKIMHHYFYLVKISPIFEDLEIVF